MTYLPAKPSQSTCFVCDSPITWGLNVGRKWIPLDESPNGNNILLRNRYVVRTDWRSIDEIPATQRKEMSNLTLLAWKQAFEGGRYFVHREECRKVAGTSKAMRLDKDDLKAVLP